VIIYSKAYKTSAKNTHLNTVHFSVPKESGFNTTRVLLPLGYATQSTCEITMIILQFLRSRLQKCSSYKHRSNLASQEVTRWAEHVECMENMRNMYRIFSRKIEENRPLRRTRHRWDNNIKRDLKEIQCGLVSTG
jgi:hypothetical protein